MIAAVDVYNKPDFRYREETFAILIVNAWELLLKAFILKNNLNSPSLLYVRERRTLKSGKKSTKQYIKKNSSGNPITIGLTKALNVIQSRGWHKFDRALIANLKAIVEIRDNSVHLANESPELSHLVQQLGSATLSNYVRIVQHWFDEDLSKYNFYVMPIAFFRSFTRAEAVHLSTSEKRVIDAINALRDQCSTQSDAEYNLMIEMSVHVTGTSGSSDARLTRGNDPDALPITLKEEDFRERYPWDYRQLTTHLVARYSDFVQNKRYHDIRKTLLEDQRYCIQRHLDPRSPSTTSKFFFSRNVLNVFDRHYDRETKT